MKKIKFYDFLENVSLGFMGFFLSMMFFGMFVKTSPNVKMTESQEIEVREQYNIKKKIKIAIVDVGVDFSHPLLKNFRSKNQEFESLDISHGTSVAGVIVNHLNQIYSNKAQALFEIQSFKYDLSQKNSYSYLMNLKKAIDSEPDILNISTSGEEFFDLEASLIKLAQMKGIKVIVAAGNDASFQKHYPCSLEKVLCVGHLDGNKINYRSNYGDDVKLYAQGTSVYVPILGKMYDYASGSSFATPVVSAYEASLLVDRSKTEKYFFGKIKIPINNRSVAGGLNGTYK